MFVAVHDYDEFVYRGCFSCSRSAPRRCSRRSPIRAAWWVASSAARLPRWLGERSYGIYLWHCRCSA